MNKQETVQVITLLAGNYDNIAKKDSTQKQLMINTWYDCLGDLDYKLVLQAVKKTMIEKPYPPTIADIRQSVVDMTNPVRYTPLEDWDECYKMMANGTYMTQEEFDKHSPICKRFIGSLSQLRTYAMSDVEVINTVVKSNFLKQYENIKKEEREDKLLPTDLKEKMLLLQQKAIKQIGG